MSEKAILNHEEGMHFILNFTKIDMISQRIVFQFISGEIDMRQEGVLLFTSEIPDETQGVFVSWS